MKTALCQAKRICIREKGHKGWHRGPERLVEQGTSGNFFFVAQTEWMDVRRRTKR